MATMPPLDLETAASLVPEPLCSRSHAFADREDQLILADLHRQYGRPDGSLAFQPTWQAGYSSGTAAGWAMFGLARWEQVQKPEFRPPSPFAEVAYGYADAMLQKGRDIHGPRQTGLFLDLLDRQSLSPLETLPPAPVGIVPGNRRAGGANLQSHENLLRLLYFLSELSGEERYAQAADDALKGMLLNTPSPVTGLLPWGEHMSWDVKADDAISDSALRLHEFSRPWMLWDRCFALAPEQSRQLAQGLWRFHVVDQAAGDVSPSADFDGASRTKAACGRPVFSFAPGRRLTPTRTSENFSTQSVKCWGGTR